MITSTRNALLGYVADVIETAERYGAMVLPPADEPEVALEQIGQDLVFELQTRLPAERHSRDVDLTLKERWTPDRAGRYALGEYAYELRHNEIDYRRSMHRHHVDAFVRRYDVATHEHCEASIGHATCAHYGGPPVNGAIDGFFRLYGLWLSGSKPDCSELRCLE